MKKKYKNKGKKALAAVSAVVAARLSPGIIAASPVQGSNAGSSAAEVVAISGMAYSFDDLYAMQQSGNRTRPGGTPQHATRYGSPSGVKPHPTSYGVTRPRPKEIVITVDIVRPVMMGLMEYCAHLIDADARGIIITPDSDLTRELGMNEEDLKKLKAVIEEYYGIEISHHRFRLVGQLNTLRLISEYIVKLKTVWE